MAFIHADNPGRRNQGPEAFAPQRHATRPAPLDPGLLEGGPKGQTELLTAPEHFGAPHVS